MIKISYSGYRFPPEIIQHAIWLYIRFTLSGERGNYNTQRFEADSLADETVSGEPVCGADSLRTGKFISS
jgi:hypothetical protein